jgi:MFS family permease
VGTQLPARAWIIVALLWGTVLSNYLARALFTTMHGSLVAAVPMTEAQFGLLTSSLLWTYGLASPVAGFLADRFRRSRVIMTSMLLWSITTWLTSYARSFDQLVVLRSGMGLIEACYVPAALALICDYHRGRTRSLAIAIHHTGYVVGLALSGLAGWLAELHSWHYVFSAVGLIGICYTLPLGLFLRDRPRAENIVSMEIADENGMQFSHALKSLLGRGSFLLLLAIHCLLNLVGWALIGWTAVYLQERFHLTQGFAGLTTTGYMNGAAVIGLFAGGIWADNWSRANRRARMFVPAVGALAAAPGVLLLANTSVFSVAIVGLVIYSLFVAFYDPNAMPALCEVVDPRYRATGYGMLNCVGMLAGGLGIYFSGILRDLGFLLNVVFDASAAVCVICALIYCFVWPNVAEQVEVAAVS